MAVHLITVGTSVLENYCENRDCKDFRREDDTWKESKVESIREDILEWIKENKRSCCAEIATFLKVIDNDDKREAYLFHTEGIGKDVAMI